MKKDQAWTLFRDSLVEELASAGISRRELAVRLGRPPHDVSNWLKGASTPPLGELSLIAQVLNVGAEGADTYDPLHFPRVMGIVGEDADGWKATELAFRTQKLSLHLRQVREAAAQHSRLFGPAQIFQAAARSRKWAVALWPAVEGPPDCRMHVADRVDIRRTLEETGGDTDDLQKSIWNDPDMRNALRSTHAITSPARPRWASAGDAASSWSIPHLGSPRSPTVQQPYSGALSICVASLTLSGWPQDVADLVALSIGYGLSTTRDIAMEVHGLEFGRTTSEHRFQAHQYFLNNVPRRRVWSHYGWPTAKWEDQPFVAPNGAWHSNTLFVWLDETPEVLEARAGTRKGMDELTGAELVETRERIVRNIGELSGQQLKQTHVVPMTVLPTSDETTRNAKWEEVLNAAKSVVDWLATDWNIHPTPETRDEVRATMPEIANPWFRWLDARST